MGSTQGAENDDGCTIASNKLRHEYLIDSINHYGVALTLGEKHVYQALPRMLAMWLEFTSQTCNADDQSLYESQEQMNRVINSFASKIPEHVFYTALPQLISSVVHTNEETSKNVALILRNVLARYPCQAMWSCGWLRFSKNNMKQKAGEVSAISASILSDFISGSHSPYCTFSQEIFASAIKKLRRTPNGKQTDGVLSTSKNIFTFFINLSE